MISLFCKVNKVLKDSSDFRSLCRSNTRRWRSLFVNKTFEFVYPIQPGMLSFEGGELVIDTSSGTQGKHLTTRFTNFVYLSMTCCLGHLLIKIVLHVPFCKHF